MRETESLAIDWRVVAADTCNSIMLLPPLPRDILPRLLVSIYMTAPDNAPNFATQTQSREIPYRPAVGSTRGHPERHKTISYVKDHGLGSPKRDITSAATSNPFPILGSQKLYFAAEAYFGGWWARLERENAAARSRAYA